MKWNNRKPDPLAEREQSLNAEIAALERRIQELSVSAPAEETAAPKWRSTVLPAGKASAPVFSNISPPLAAEETPAAATPTVNDRRPANAMNLPKSPWRALWDRIREQIQPPPPNNPRLVNYLAAGSIQGLRPLRFEKRVARNRAIFYGLCFAGIVFFIYKLAT